MNDAEQKPSIALPPELYAVIQDVGQDEVEASAKLVAEFIRRLTGGDAKRAAVYAVTAYGLLAIECGL